MTLTLVLLLVFSSGSFLLAQNSVNEHLDSPSQRWLPQPSGDSRNQSWLDRLSRPKEILRPNSTEPKPRVPPAVATDKDSQSPKLDPRQAEQLRELIRQFGDQIPSNLMPKNLNDLSDEAIGKALRDPKIQEQVREFMKRYRSPDDQNTQPPTTRDTNELDQESDTIRNSQNSKPGASNSPRVESPNTKNPSSNRRQEFERSIRELAQQIDRTLSEDKTKVRPNETSGTTAPSDLRGGNKGDSGNSEVRRKLEEIGLDKTLKELVDRAKLESKKRPTEPSNETSLGSSASKTDSAGTSKKDWLDSVVKKIDDLSKNESKQVGSRTSTKDPSSSSKGTEKPIANSTPQANPKTDSKERSWNKAAVDSIKEWNRYLNAQSQPRTNNRERTPTETKASSDSSASNGQPFTPWDWSLPKPSVFVAVALVLGLFALGGWIAFSQGRSATKQSPSPSFATDLIASPTKIQSRSDVILAFHQLAFRIASPLEHWWTSNRIASHVSKTTPDKESAMCVAKEVYEQSRYMPDEIALTDEQLNSVRTAIRTLDGIK